MGDWGWTAVRNPWLHGCALLQPLAPFALPLPWPALRLTADCAVSIAVDLLLMNETTLIDGPSRDIPTQIVDSHASQVLGSAR